MFVWQKCLSVPDGEATFYHRMIRRELVDMFSSPRRRVIEIGSSGGYTGKYCKEKFPGCEYWGFELNEAAARESLQNIDKVICGRFEDQRLDLLGLQPESVDGVVLGDVLEHMYDPWRVLTALLPWLAPDAELAVSLPNVRNLWLMNEIAEGRFGYEENGLLDITHIRFFTPYEMQRMMAETGYEIVHGGFALDERLRDFFNQFQRLRGPCQLNYKSVSLRTVGESVPELCARQFIFRARPSAHMAKNLLGPFAAPVQQLMKDIDQSAEADEKHYVASIAPPPAENRRMQTRLFAFYLPQFHPTPENSKWWGEGFTEWNNVARARPAFAGHYQPRHPGELGYYDLRVPEVMARQAELAKMAGLSGFIFYHYWFSGRRMLQMPMQQYMDRYAEMGLPFMAMWCNENWRRTWVDKKEHENDMLMQHLHLPDDPERFIDDLTPALQHPGYYRIDGKPVLLVYPFIHPNGALAQENAAATVARWRRRAADNGVGDLLIGVQEKSDLQTHGRQPAAQDFGADFLFEFPPNNSLQYPASSNATGVHAFYEGNDINLIHYQSLASAMNAVQYPSPVVRTVLAGSWDNTARRGRRANVFHGCTPDLYESWLRQTAERARQTPAVPGHPMVFINAWNEWAEGVYLEPDRKYGYALLAATQRVAYGQPPLPHAGVSAAAGGG